MCRFDAQNNAAIGEDEFVAGWLNVAKVDGPECLAKIKSMVGEDNIML